MDWICKQYYGDEAFVLQVLDANPRLVEKGPVLSAGIEIILPDVSRIPTMNETLFQ